MPDTSLQLMWTVLPRGIDASATPSLARLSVLLTPRVSLIDPSAPATLADVPDLLDWPSQLAGLQLSVEVDTGSGDPAPVPTTEVAGDLDSALWQAVLPATTAVENRVFDQDDLSSRPITTYNKSTVVSALRGGYAQVFRSSPVELPPHGLQLQAFSALFASTPPTPLLTPGEIAGLDEATVRSRQAVLAADLLSHARAGTLADAVRHAADLAAQLSRLTGGPAGLLFPSTGSEAEEFGRLLAFHTAPSRSDGTAGDSPNGFEPELHSIITLLHEHPGLMSRLGLLIDLTVPADDLPQISLTSTAQARLRITVGAGSGRALQAGATHVSPWTAFVRDAHAVFTARPSTPAAPEMVAGLLNLALPDAYSLGQVDEDGAAIKAVSMTQPTTQDASGLPAMRTTGPSLIRALQGQALQARIDQAHQNEAAVAENPAETNATLYAEDVTRGYRIDIRDHADGVWRSLHERAVTYSVPGLPDITVSDEGVTQPAGALDPQATMLYVHESLARWEGWSLSVQRPGQVVGDDGPISLPSTPQPDGVPLTSSSTVVPGSLPRLRFGHSYDVRARTVDLGGGGLDLAGADAAVSLLGELDVTLPVLPGAGQTFTFQRFEPVPSPVAVPREKPSEGESAERLVIRSSRTENADQLAVHLNGLASTTGGASADTRGRYLGSCERHLVPPKAAQQTAERAGLLDDLTPAASYLVSCKDRGGLADSAVLDITTGENEALGDVPDPFTGGTRSAVELVGSGSAAYAVHHEASLLLPYLPDWLAAAAVLRGLPGLEVDQRADVGPDGSLIISTLGPGSFPVPSPVSVTTIPFTGTWPLLEPLRLQLVEGSGPPSWDPNQRVLSVGLPAGQTATVTLSCALPEGALDMLGQWQWLLASAAASGEPPGAFLIELAARGLTWPLTPFREITLVHASLQPVLDPTINSLAVSRTPGDTGATLSGQIVLDADSTAHVELIASWTDPTGPAASATHVVTVPLPPETDVGRLDAGAGGAADVLTLSGPKVHQEFRDTKHRRVTYEAVASSRFADYFPSGVDVGPTSVSSAPLTVDVPSSAAPPVPRVREAVPMWRWDRPDDPSLPRRRCDAGVRVLLEPPWYASGEGEQLAVVLLEPTRYPPSEEQRPHVTHWGADPAFAGSPVAGAPVPASFPAGGPAVNAVLDGTDDSISTVLVPHAVSFDAERNVYVCDIPVDPGAAYMPFVRLAVARYQPSSLPGLALSSVVALPFIQVMPERRVTLTPPTPDAPDTCGIRVDGTSYIASSAIPPPPTPVGQVGGTELLQTNIIPPAPPLIDVTVQERLPGTGDEAGWVVSGSALVATDGAILGTGLRDAPPGTPLWTGRVTLPAARTPGQFRILVTEHELLDSDRSARNLYELSYTWDDAAPGPPIPPGATEVGWMESFYRPGSRRLVFAEELIV